MLKLVFAMTVLFAVSAKGAPGEYVCANGGASEQTVQAVLNSLKCDTVKPFTVSISGKTGYIIVCCVEK